MSSCTLKMLLLAEATAASAASADIGRRMLTHDVRCWSWATMDCPLPVYVRPDSARATQLAYTYMSRGPCTTLAPKSSLWDRDSIPLF